MLFFFRRFWIFFRKITFFPIGSIILPFYYFSRVIYIVFSYSWHKSIKNHKRLTTWIHISFHKIIKMYFLAKIHKSRVFLSWCQFLEFIQDIFPRPYMLQLDIYMTRLQLILRIKNITSTIVAQFHTFWAHVVYRTY